MARTPTVSDEEIIAAAYEVLGERGANAFTISDVAHKTGLSRAAIILRFKSTRELKLKLLSNQIKAFTLEMAKLPGTPSGNNLLAVAAFIAERLGNRQGQSAFFANYAVNMQDPELAALEKLRGDTFHTAISRVMPGTSIDKHSAVIEFVAHITGNIISWIGSEDEDARRFIIMRTKKWLTLAGIPFDDPAPCEKPPA